MAEEIRFKAIYDDSDINRALTGIVQSTEAANDATREYGQVTTQAFNTAAKSAQDATIKIANTTKVISDNDAAIQRLSKDLVVLKANLLQYQQAYARFADKSGKDAQRVAGEMKKLNTQIENTEARINELTNENKNLAASAKTIVADFGQTSSAAQKTGADVEAVTKRTGTLSNLFRVLASRSDELINRLGGAGEAARFFGSQLGIAARGAAGLAGGVALAVGALVALVALPVILFFRKTIDFTALAEQKMAQLTATATVLSDRLATLGGFIVGYVKGQRSFNEVIASGILAVAGLGGALREAARDAESYTIILQRFRKEQKNFEFDSIKLEAQIARLRLAVDDETKSIGKRSAALQKASDLEQSLFARRIRDAQKEVEIARQNATEGDGLIKITDELTAATRKLSDLQLEAESAKQQDLQTLRSLREESRRAAEEEAKALEQLRNELDRLNKQIQALELEGLSPVDRLRKEQEIALQEINKFEEEIKALYAERKKTYDAADEFDRLRVLTNIKYEKAITDAVIEETGKRLEAEDLALKQRQSDQRDYFNLQLSVLDKQKSIDLAEVENIRDASKDVEQATIDKEKAKLRVELDYAVRRRDLIEKEYGENSLEARLIREQIKTIELELAEIENVDLSGFEALQKKILAALNIDQEQAALLGQTAGGALDAYLEFLDATTEAQLAVQDDIIAKTEERIERTKELLDIELERQRQGYANNVENLKQALDKQNKERDAAEQKRNAIARKAAKQRAAISAAEQIAETALLAVRIFSEAVKTAGIYGIILGAAGLAFVIARIAAVRAQAKAASADTGFKEGTPYVEGPGGPKDDRISARLSRGERVVPADINERMGGRRLTNEELFKYYELGRRVAQRKEIAIPVAAQRARASKDRAALEVAIMQHAYAQASDKAADKMIAYWKTRPVEKVVGGQKVIEWQEGSGVRRQRIKKS